MEELIERMYRKAVAAIRRCESDHPDYGGRGIRVEFPDAASFTLYLLTLPGCEDRSLTLDRTDVDGNYAVGNLRFATQSVQRTNQRQRLKSRVRRCVPLLCRLRIAAGLKLKELEALSGVSGSTLSRVERGQTTRMCAPLLRRALAAYGKLLERSST